MASLSIAPHIVEKVFNHQAGTISGVAAIYNRFDYIEEKRHARSAWALRLHAVVRSGQEGDDEATDTRS